MRPISDVVNEIVAHAASPGALVLRDDISVQIIRSVVSSKDGVSIVFEDGSSIKADDWECDIDSFAPGGCILTSPTNAQIACSPYFVENFLI